VKHRLSAWWYELRSSLWFVPAVMAVAAVILALLMVRLDERLLLDQRAGSSWLFGGGAEGARGVLSAIAGTMITVTATVFSITIVALQLASSQFTPRVLRSFTADRGNQVVLGVFIATFTYALLVLRAVRSAAQDREIFVPSASVTVAIGLTVISLGFLIYYIHHAARSIQASVIIGRAATDTLDLINRLFPSDGDWATIHDASTELPSVDEPVVVQAAHGGYVQGIDHDALIALGDEYQMMLRAEPRLGEYVLPGASLASVWPASVFAGDEDGGRIAVARGHVKERIQAAFTLGLERTLEADVELGFRQLADIGIKALSPGINDPTTAIVCIDRIAEALVCLGQRGQPCEVRTGKDGAVRLVLRGPAFDRLVDVAYRQIRHYGAGDPEVAEHLILTLGRAAALVPRVLRDPMVREARLLMADARDELRRIEDANRVVAAGAWAMADGESPSGAVVIAES